MSEVFTIRRQLKSSGYAYRDDDVKLVIESNNRLLAERDRLAAALATAVKALDGIAAGQCNAMWRSDIPAKTCAERRIVNPRSMPCDACAARAALASINEAAAAAGGKA